MYKYETAGRYEFLLPNFRELCFLSILQSYSVNGVS